MESYYRSKFIPQWIQLRIQLDIRQHIFTNWTVTRRFTLERHCDNPKIICQGNYYFESQSPVFNCSHTKSNIFSETMRHSTCVTYYYSWSIENNDKPELIISAFQKCIGLWLRKKIFSSNLLRHSMTGFPINIDSRDSARMYFLLKEGNVGSTFVIFHWNHEAEGKYSIKLMKASLVHFRGLIFFI